jgi:hypothetical protein
MKQGQRLLTAAVVCSLILAAAIPLGQTSPARADGPTWTKYSGEVDLENELYVTDAWVIRDDNTYRMWYTRLDINQSLMEMLPIMSGLHLCDIVHDLADLDFDAALDDLAALADTHHNVSDILEFLDSRRTVIGYAVSTNGINWKVINPAVLAGGSNQLWDNLGFPCVINDNGIYKMWYTRDRVDLSQRQLESLLSGLNEGDVARQNALAELAGSLSTVIGYAESRDGENWTVVKDEVLAGSGYVLEGVSDPCVIKDGDTYEMWYTQLTTELTEADLAGLLVELANDEILDAEALLGIWDATAMVISYTTSDDGINWAVPEEVLSEDTPPWDSVASPSVIKTDGGYQMWYTRTRSDLDLGYLQSVLDELKRMYLSDLLYSLELQNLDKFLTNLSDLDTADFEALLAETGTVIGYAESPDGVNWEVTDPEDVTGSSASLWSSIAAPCVLKHGQSYKMWYTQGIDYLSVAQLVDLLQGTKPSVGYAYYIPHSGGSPAGGGVASDLNLEAVMGLSHSYYDISPQGSLRETIDITSEDGLISVLIPKGTYILDEAGEPVTRLEFTPDGAPPPVPQDAHIIGPAYRFEPGGTSFDPPLTISWRYNPDDLPAGTAEANLVIACYNDASSAWVTLPSEVDTAENTISATAAHFSTFAVVAYSGAPPPPPPTPAAFTTASLSISPTGINPGETVTISVLASNTGEEAGIYTLTLIINGTVEARQRIVLAGSASQTVSFTISRHQAGTYSVDINGASGYFTVGAAAPSATTLIPNPQPLAEPSGQLIGGILAATAAAITIPLLLRRRRSREITANRAG